MDKVSILISLIIDVINLLFGADITKDQFGMFLYVFGSFTIICLIYYVLWRRLSYYADLMNREIAKMWVKAEETMKEEKSRAVVNVRMERLKREYGNKIDRAQKQRDFILKYVPLMRWFYSRTIKKDAPVFLTLPNNKK